MSENAIDSSRPGWKLRKIIDGISKGQDQTELVENLELLAGLMNRDNLWLDAESLLGSSPPVSAEELQAFIGWSDELKHIVPNLCINGEISYALVTRLCVGRWPSIKKCLAEASKEASKPTSVLASMRVPILLVHPVDRGRAFVAWLDLEVVEGTFGPEPHPAHTLSKPLIGDAADALQQAFLAAYAAASTEDGTIAMKRGFLKSAEKPDEELPNCQARYRLHLPDDGQDGSNSDGEISTIKGPSIGAAAFYGWYAALTGRKYDHRVVVTGAIESINLKARSIDLKEQSITTEPSAAGIAFVEFHAVGGIQEKVRAAVAYTPAAKTKGGHPFDTIAVPDRAREETAKTNIAEARDALADALAEVSASIGVAKQIRVIPLQDIWMVADPA